MKRHEEYRTFGAYKSLAEAISLADLKTNKRASGRNKDLADLDNLP